MSKKTPKNIILLELNHIPLLIVFKTYSNTKNQKKKITKDLLLLRFTTKNLFSKIEKIIFRFIAFYFAVLSPNSSTIFLPSYSFIYFQKLVVVDFFSLGCWWWYVYGLAGCWNTDAQKSSIAHKKRAQNGKLHAGYGPAKAEEWKCFSLCQDPVYEITFEFPLWKWNTKILFDLLFGRCLSKLGLEFNFATSFDFVGRFESGFSFALATVE